MHTILRFLKSDEGATAVEYAVMVAVIAIVIIQAATTLGRNTSTAFSNLNDQWS